MLTGKIGKWNQFASNKQKLDVEDSFDENVYTSRLNKEELGYENDPTRRAVGERD
jgi:PAB1-binding protein PBP1